MATTNKKSLQKLISLNISQEYELVYFVRCIPQEITDHSEALNKIYLALVLNSKSSLQANQPSFSLLELSHNDSSGQLVG